MVELFLMNGTYELHSLPRNLTRFDHTTVASEVQVRGEGSGVILDSTPPSSARQLQASQAPSSPPPAPLLSASGANIFTIASGSPPITLTSLTMRGHVGAPAVAFMSNSSPTTGVIDLTIDSCHFLDNPGSAIEVAGGRVLVMRSAFYGNGHSGSDGGAITIRNSDFRMQSCALDGNGAAAHTNGGAIQMLDGYAELINCELSQNSARYGGAIWTSGGRLWLRGTSLRLNFAQERGGAIFATRSIVTLTNKTFVEDNNLAEGFGHSTFAESSASIIYALPAPRGHWIANPISCNSPQQRDEDACAIEGHAGSVLWTLASGGFDDYLPYLCAPGTQTSSDQIESTQMTPQCTGPCPAGFACRGGQNAPALCPSGHFCPQGVPSEVPCAFGTFNTLQGQSAASACLICPSGFWCGSGQVNPQACPDNTYSDDLGAKNSSSCKRCPGNAITLGQNTTSIAQCICGASLFDEIVSEADIHCTLCPPGGDCSSPPSKGIDLHTIPIRRGYYRLDNSSTDVRRCPDASAGCSGRSECEQSHSGCFGSLEGDDENVTVRHNTPLCRAGLQGVFCMLCSSSEEFYIAADNAEVAHCETCSQVAVESTSVVVAIMLATALAVTTCVVLATRRLSPAWKRRALRSYRKMIVTYSLHNKVKICIGFYQICTKVEVVYDILFPPLTRSFLLNLRFALSLGLEGIPLGCFGASGYTARLMFWTAAPVCTVLVVLCISGAKRRFWDKARGLAALDHAVPIILRIAFLSYPIVTNIAFEAFSCYQFEDGSMFLIADVSIECGYMLDEPAHARAKLAAGVAILIYPIGSLVLNATILYMTRHAILNRTPTPLSRAARFLHREYEPSPRSFWWECMEMLRRLLLVGLLVVVPYPRGSMMQIALAITLSLIYLVIQQQVQPYRTPYDNHLASMSSFSLVLLFVGCSVFKLNTLTELEMIQVGMSRGQEEDFVLSPAPVAVVLFLSVIATLVFSSVLLGVQAYQDIGNKEALARRRFRRELKRLDDKARRECMTTALEIMEQSTDRFAAANFLFGPGGLHPDYWGVSKKDLIVFREEVRVALAKGEITNPFGHDPSHRFHYPQWKFDDPKIGPNMHQVNFGLIKPITLNGTKLEPAALPGWSYALMRNYETGGLPCELFFSHAWDEGVFELIDNALSAWPASCRGAYICCLSNPQNLDIGALLGGKVELSPFNRILAGDVVTHFQMLANNNTPIHSRLW